MSNAKEIKTRMKSIQDTMKITSAMYMISSSKMQKAKKVLADSVPYFYAQQNAVARFMNIMPESHSIFFDKGIPEEKRKVGYVVVTADKGLAGAYNHNVLKMASEEMAKHEDVKLYVVGELGRQYFLRQGVKMDGEFGYTVQNPSLHRARMIEEKLVDLYVRDELDEIHIIYTEMISSFRMEPKDHQLLPLSREEYTTARHAGNYREVEFFPSPEAVLDNLIPNVVTGFVYGALVESFASEHNSRMMAMRTATDSAKDMLHDLSIQYNRVRQAAITQEITEVIGGAKAQKNKK